MLRNRKNSQIAATAVGIEESRTTLKDVEIDVEGQINVTEDDTELCQDINMDDEDFSILDATVVENVPNLSCIFL